MNRSISIVEYKVQQAAFFMRQVDSCGHDMFAAQCYTDAFAASARSVTLAMQAVVGNVAGFSDWYAKQQEVLKQDQLARFFVKYRNVSSKIGDTVVRGGGSHRRPDGMSVVRYYFLPTNDLPEVPEDDVVSICGRHMKSLLQLIFDVMTEFKCDLDDRWYFTEGNFCKMGKTFQDAMMEAGFPPEFADVSPLSEPEKWRVLRRTQTAGCQLNDLFMEYLGRCILGPDDEEPIPADGALNRIEGTK